MTSISVSLTSFMDFIYKTGTPKLTVVRNYKNSEYSPAFDFYKQLREAIIEFHANSSYSSKEYFDKFLLTVSDNKKISNYNQVIKGYKKFLGRKKIDWFEPPKAVFSYRTLSVNVNPELGLVIDNQPYLIKLYFKSNEAKKRELLKAYVQGNEEDKIKKFEALYKDGFLKKNQADIVNHIMKNAFQHVELPSKCSFAVLDIKSPKLYELTNFEEDNLLLIQSEAAGWIEYWNNL